MGYRIKQSDNPLKTNKSACFTQLFKYVHYVGTNFRNITKDLQDIMHEVISTFKQKCTDVLEIYKNESQKKRTATRGQ
jgi:hypothetical protein